MTLAPFIINILILVGIYIISAVALNLALGFTGMINLGHVALFGIGAYTSALLTLNGFPFVVAFILSGLIASFFGFILVLATKKLKGDYYALATLGFAFVVYSLLLNLTNLTRGPLGIPGIQKPNLFGFVVNTGIEYLLFVSFIAAISVFLLSKIVKSPFGKLIEATRDDELGLRVLGKNTSLLKYKVLSISAFFAGIAGSLFAHYISFIDPGTFFIDELILVLAIVIVGGIASIKGTIIASFILVTLPEILRFLSLPSAIVGPSRQIVYALLLLVILLYKSRGLCGRIDLE